MEVYTLRGTLRLKWEHCVAEWARILAGESKVLSRHNGYFERAAAFDFDNASDEERLAVLGEAYQTRCDECGAERVTSVELGEEMGYESATARVCLPCLRKAVEMAEEAELTIVTS